MSVGNARVQTRSFWMENDSPEKLVIAFAFAYCDLFVGLALFLCGSVLSRDATGSGEDRSLDVMQ